jgi:serine/threonine-protein kinase
MEYVEGMDLNALLRRCSQTKTALPIGFALRILGDTLKGLDYAHRAKDELGRPLGIVHRDVSPSNVLISLEGEVKICDFGIAHANDLVESKAPQVDEAIKGKAGYMSPEHAKGEALDARADVFAAGILLWELLAGRRLYRTEAGRPPLLEQARRADIPPLPEKGLPNEAELRAILKKALAPKREDRYASAGAMERDIEAYAAQAKLAASPLKLGEWICDRFGMATITQRRARERLVSDHPIEAAPEAAPVSVPTPPVTPSLRALQDALLSERMTPVPGPSPSASGPYSSSAPPPPQAPPSASGGFTPPLPPQAFPPIAVPPAPISVALGTVDLGPPSSTMLAPRPRSNVKYIYLTVAIALIALVVLVVARFVMQR